MLIKIILLRWLCPKAWWLGMFRLSPLSKAWLLFWRVGWRWYRLWW